MLVHLGDKRLGVLVVAVILAGLALRLAWGLHGPEAFGFGFEAWAQEEGETSCPGTRLVKELDGKGDQLTDTFDTEAGFFRLTPDLRGTRGRREPPGTRDWRRRPDPTQRGRRRQRGEHR